MAELTFPFDEQGTALGARFTDRGCISCPTGYAYTADDALGALERTTNKVYLEGWKDYQKPEFPLANIPIRPATYQQMTRIKGVKHTAGYSQVFKTQFNDPTPNIDTFQVNAELINRCGGNLALATMIGNMNSIGCAPPFGNTGFIGKRTYTREAFTGTLNLGPFCITSYLDLMDFRNAMDAYQREAMKAAGMALEYEKIRRFIAMSPNNGAAVAGTRSARFASGNFADIPNSAGSFEWLIDSIERGLGAEIGKREGIVVKVSQQIFEYWVKKYVADNGNDFNLVAQMNWADLRVQAQGYQGSFAEGQFVLVSKRTNRRITIMVNNYDPIYLEVTRTGAALGQWEFQDWYLQELGSDIDNGGEGVWQKFNPYYGDPEQCEGAEKTLAELILIFTEKAFHYEAFPNSPFSGFTKPGVNTDLNNLWNSMMLRWYTGVEVDQYFLNKINEMVAGHGGPCLSNRYNTWFAGDVTFGLQLVEDDPTQMMALIVAVPSSGSPIEASEVLTSVSPGDPIVVTPVDHSDENPLLCKDYDQSTAPPDAPVGCFQVPEVLIYNLPESDDVTVTVTFQRVGGTSTSIATAFTVTDGTATEGSAPTDHFELANGTLTFAANASTATKNIILHPIHREEGDSQYVEAVINWTDDDEIICEGGFESTTLRLKLWEAP